ncbi:MAG: GntR family transcriptional regulator [Janthinobacterium lividum]
MSRSANEIRNETRIETRLPAAERLEGTPLGRIERGEYQSGEWLPTERELAAEFRADRSTIRAALSSLAQKDLIVREPGRRSRVSASSQDTAHSRSADARRSPSVALQTLALLSPQTPHYPATSNIQRGALHILRQAEAPYQLVVVDNYGETREETFRRERQAFEVIRNEAIRGVVMWQQGYAETLTDLRRLQETGIPMVLVDRYPPGFVCNFVGIDNAEAAQEAVTYLLELGHRRIGHLTMDGDTAPVRERERGYQAALLAQGIASPPEWVVRLSHPTSMHPPVMAAVDHFLSLPEPPTAIFAMNDLLAHALLIALKACGVPVPEQISVMGFDDLDRDAPHPSPLTTVHQPFEHMGRKAMGILLAHLAAPAGAPVVFQHVLLPTRLIVRSSCARFPMK